MKKLTILLLAFLLLAACSSQNEEHEGQTHTTPNGDLQETTASIKELPTFLDEQPEQVRLVYQIAAANADLLDFIPCYCGCGEIAGHQSNRNCFSKEIREDGSIVWDDHGTRCGVCLQIAVQAVQMKQDGMSTKEIRDKIDSLYGDSTAKPTPTPMPAS